MPDGPYVIGPLDGGEPIRKADGVGLLPSGTALASSVVGLDHCVRTFHRLTGVPLEVVVRMASLTPARIAGWDHEIGSIAPGKRADLVLLDLELNVRQVYRDGRLIWERDGERV
jgi:N-acetylglucosamine-6-phosphate deacetylase